MTIRHERVDNPPRGLLGGLAGSPGRDYLNGERIAAKSRLDINLGDVVTFETPGGGGMGPPEERAVEKIAADIRSGLVTQEAADTLYSRGELKAKKHA
jgi:N-methylhydantoinase B